MSAPLLLRQSPKYGEGMERRIRDGHKGGIGQRKTQTHLLRCAGMRVQVVRLGQIIYFVRIQMEYRKERKRAAVSIEGRVQGVGFRPFVYRLAVENGLTGFVVNTPEGVYAEVEGPSHKIKEFLDRVKYHPPEHAAVKHMSVSFLPAKNGKEFRIEKSRASAGGKKGSIPKDESRTEISPDIAACRQCVSELFSPQDRRHLFPFINCTNCGPRFSIIRELPYDRKNTSMCRFMMCPDCYSEYLNPLERRFHAQPDCCFACGPEYILFDGQGKKKDSGIDAVREAASLIEKGHIVAVKGIGGYHLVCDAGNRQAVKTLRERKKRGDKPFALMSGDPGNVRMCCTVNRQEEELLSSWRAPVVILRKKNTCRLPEEISPRNKYLGFFLPYAPVHYLLFHFGRFRTVVATSANMADEPIVYRDKEAFEKLPGIADYILSSNRDIETGCDDSVARVEPFDKNIHVIRRARGFVPEPVKTPFLFEEPVFAAGPNEKNTFSLGMGGRIVTSQHIGSLENMESFGFYRETYEHFRKIFHFTPRVISHDFHPDYASTRFAKELSAKEGILAVGVQHHHAHIASCMLDNGLPDRKVIGVALDGTGYGEGGDIRGCEFLIASYGGYERYAWLDYIPLPGGDRAVKEVWRTGIACLYKAFGSGFLSTGAPLLGRVGSKLMDAAAWAVEKNVNCPGASSMGRLFDAVAAITGVCTEATYDAQAAILLESVMEPRGRGRYGFDLKQSLPGGGVVIDPYPLVRQVVEDISKGVSPGVVSYRFHAAVLGIITEICKRINKERNIDLVVLSGGVFQNSFILNGTCRMLAGSGLKVCRHRFLPSNDGGISAGQAAVSNALAGKDRPVR